MDQATYSDLVKAGASLLMIVISVCSAWLTAWMHKRFSTQQLDKAQGFARSAVHAVEQTLADAPNTQKYRTATEFLDQMLGAAKIDLSDQDKAPLIEAAVHEMKLFSPVAGTLVANSLEPLPQVSAPDLEALVKAAVQFEMAEMTDRMKGSLTPVRAAN